MPPGTGTELVEVRIVAPPDTPPVLAKGSNEGPVAGAGSEIVTSFRILSFLPFRARWVALITDFEWNHYFADVQKEGPFRSFHHRHELQRAARNGVDGTLVRDNIDYQIGFGLLGTLAQRLFVSRQLRRTFTYRQRRLLELLSST